MVYDGDAFVLQVGLKSGTLTPLAGRTHIRVCIPQVVPLTMLTKGPHLRKVMPMKPFFYETFRDVFLSSLRLCPNAGVVVAANAMFF